MPTRRRSRIVRRQVEPSGAELAFGAALLSALIVAALFLAGVLAEYLLSGFMLLYTVCRGC